ncbi:hypothetical protein BCR34DRAFT_281036 [Clohesyomyces aquaticus]|uniref:Uncharacterized protein n=1 Tax=Clohesyomyces aquaticus TaxID=1231657 RepID=A0A1Y1ZRP1_9PLEO|nr:hypothetical protein BCR34DRAFT_281036 [Clohesyomyces aquaticus]
MSKTRLSTSKTSQHAHQTSNVLVIDVAAIFVFAFSPNLNSTAGLPNYCTALGSQALKSGTTEILGHSHSFLLGLLSALGNRTVYEDNPPIWIDGSKTTKLPHSSYIGSPESGGRAVSQNTNSQDHHLALKHQLLGGTAHREHALDYEADFGGTPCWPTCTAIWIRRIR